MITQERASPEGGPHMQRPCRLLKHKPIQIRAGGSRAVKGLDKPLPVPFPLPAGASGFLFHT